MAPARSQSKKELEAIEHSPPCSPLCSTAESAESVSPDRFTAKSTGSVSTAASAPVSGSVNCRTFGGKICCSAAVCRFAKKASVSATWGVSRSTILRQASSLACTASARLGAALSTLPHFSTLFCGNTTVSPTPARGNTSLTKGAARAASKPLTAATCPGMEIQARSADTN